MSTNFPNLEKFTGKAELSDLSSDIIKEIQTILKLNVDGIAGQETYRAFAAFKTDRFLDNPTVLGESSAANLLEAQVGHFVSEQDSNIPSTINEEAGEKNGRSMSLPNGKVVFCNEYIIDGIPFTWGEMTKGCDPRRTPKAIATVDNIYRTIEALGIVRERYGKPIAITSGYRPAALGIGVKNSKHILGLAVDVCPMNRSDLYAVYEIILSVKNFKGVGRGMDRGFVHADCRTWRGKTIIFNY